MNHPTGKNGWYLYGTDKYLPAVKLGRGNDLTIGTPRNTMFGSG